MLFLSPILTFGVKLCFLPIYYFITLNNIWLQRMYKGLPISTHSFINQENIVCNTSFADFWTFVMKFPLSDNYPLSWTHQYLLLTQLLHFLTCSCSTSTNKSFKHPFQQLFWKLEIDHWSFVAEFPVLYHAIEFPIVHAGEIKLQCNLESCEKLAVWELDIN